MGDSTSNWYGHMLPPGARRRSNLHELGCITGPLQPSPASSALDRSIGFSRPVNIFAKSACRSSRHGPALRRGADKHREASFMLGSSVRVSTLVTPTFARDQDLALRF